MKEPRTYAFYFETGYNAYRMGLTSFGCPFKYKTMEQKAWFEGYAKAKREKPSKWAVNPIPVRKPAVVPIQQQAKV